MRQFLAFRGWILAVAACAVLAAGGCARGSYVKVKREGDVCHCSINGYRVQMDATDTDIHSDLNGEVVLGFPLPGDPSTTRIVTETAADGSEVKYKVFGEATLNGRCIQLRNDGLYVDGVFANNEKSKIVHLHKDGSFTVLDS